jgi:TetR/AcrR family transcriptional regulator
MTARAANSETKVPADARGRILAAARRSFATVGFEGAATRQIAADAGVAQSLLLYHFGSKDALWRAVIDQMFGDLNARMTLAARSARAGSVRDRLLAVIRAFIELCAQDADIHRIMTIEGRQPTERLQWLVERHLQANHLEACALIREGQAAGTVRPGDPTLLYYSFIAIAGTAFSLAPEIALVSGNTRAVEPDAIEALITALLFTAE